MKKDKVDREENLNENPFADCQPKRPPVPYLAASL